MGKASVSGEQIACAKEIGIEEYILAHEPDNVKRIGNALYLKDHDSLEISNGLWCWHSRGIGGKNVVDYLIKVRGFSFVDAVLHLVGDENIVRNVEQKARPPTVQNETRLLNLPPRNRDNNKVIAYLESRGIEKSLILECIKTGILYESKGFGNCIFVGRDEHGKSRYAAVRGIYGSFKADAVGSDKRYGFSLPHKGDIHSVAVYESPIDLLSHAVIDSEFSGWRLSLGGTSLLALTHFLELHREIDRIIVCTDNDEAGNLMAAKIAQLSGFLVERAFPAGGAKDWNDALRNIRKGVDILEDKRKEIRFINSDYKEVFSIKDGESIRFRSGYDYIESVIKCRWIDETHTRLGGSDYHNSQWAEICERNGHKFEAAGPENKIDILTARYGEKLQEVSVPMTEAALKKLVGGSYKTETLYYPSQTNQFRDKIIEIQGKAFGAVLRGKNGIAVCGLSDGVLTSLHPYNAQKYKREMGVIEAPKSVVKPKSANKKPSLLGGLEAAKIEAKAINAASAAENATPKKKRGEQEV